MHKEKHPLVKAVEMFEKAEEEGAHPRIIKNLENIVSLETKKLLNNRLNRDFLPKLVGIKREAVKAGVSPAVIKTLQNEISIITRELIEL